MKISNDPRIINQRMIEAIKCGRYEQAIAMGEECVRNENIHTPDFIYLNLGKAYLATGADDKAEEFFSKAVNFERHNTRKNPISRRAQIGRNIIEQITKIAAMEEYGEEEREAIITARTGLIAVYDEGYPGLREALAGEISAKADVTAAIARLRSAACRL